LGIGTTTAIFSVVEAVLIRPLPFHDSQNLVRVLNRNSYPDMVDWIEQTRSFEGFGGYNAWSFDWLTSETPERIQGAIVTGDLLPLIGASAAEGRVIGPADNLPGGERVVLLSHDFWMGRLGGIRPAIGTTLTLNGEPFTVIGILPAGFSLPSVDAGFFVPHQVVSPETAAQRGVHFLISIGRLAKGVTLDEAQADLDTVAARLEQLYPDENTGRRFAIEPWGRSVGSQSKSALLMLFGAVGLVLLVACANVAGLLLARTARREREVALRSSLGATRGRLVRQFLLESVLLGTLGGALGLGLAFYLTRVIVVLAPSELPRRAEIAVHWDVLVFCAVVSLAAGVLFGLAPALQANRIQPVAALREAACLRGSPRHHARSALIVAQVAVAVVLVMGAGLLVKSFYRLLDVDPGFRKDGLVTMDFRLPFPEFREIAKRTSFFDAVLSRLDVIPGVEGVAVITDLPFGGGAVPHNLTIEGRAFAEGAEPEIYYRGISPDYFEVMGIRLLQGRAFSDEDREGALPVAIVNEAFAKAWLAGESPLEKRIRWARRDEVRWMTIVGVVSDVKPSALDASEVEAVYVPFRQEQDWWRNWMSVTVRSGSSTDSIAPSIRSAVAELHPGIPVANIRPMTGLIRDSASDRRFQLLLFGGFATSALFLAAVGLYGLLGYVVNERRSEMGIRLALGAEQGSLLSMVLRRGLALTAWGLALGTLVAIALSGLIRGLLFEVSPMDPAILAGLTGLFLLVALVASAMPAFRASRVDPLASIRYE
ncbi:MAG TPA: ABC transporter permease, partial [Vicinamibacteria bacterium]|nr:ABC transporter permease [Vicinamibacteria bacterium]